MTGQQTVWIVNHYAALESKDGWTGRHQALAAHLGRSGWDPVLFLASTGHPIGRQHMRGGRMRRVAKEGGVPHVMLRAPSYEGNGVGRMANMAVFALQMLLPWNTRGIDRPDVVIGSTVHPLAAWAGLRLARRHRVPFVFEIRDVWPDALIHLGQLRAGSRVARAMESLMRHLVRKADLILSPLPGVADYAAKQGAPDTPFLWVSNGAEGVADATEPERHEGDEFVFMYLGSFGNAMAVEHLISAFERVAASRPDTAMRFRLVGDGPKKAEFERQAAASSVADRIVFEPRIPRDEVIGRAGEADCLLHSLHDHAVYEYGISPNKLFDYLLAARPVVFAANARNNPIAEADAGIVVPAEDVDALAEAMLRVVDMPAAERAEMGRRGRAHLIGNYTYAALADKLALGLRTLVADVKTQNGKARGMTETRGAHVVHVSSVHPWTDNRIHYRECASLAEAGYRVTLVAVESTVDAPRDKVEVITIPRLPRLRRVVVSTARAVRIALRTGGDVFHFHDPELVWAVPLLRIMGKKVVYDAHEDLPVQVVSKPYVNRLARPFIVGVAHVLVAVARLSTHIMAATEAIAERFPRRKTSVVHNYPPLRIEEAEAPTPESRTRGVVFAGGISSGRGAEVMVAAVADPAYPADWPLTLAGTMSSALQSELESQPGWQRTTFLGQIPPVAARDLLLDSRVGLVLLQDTQAHRDALPTKMFEYFAAGVPVIASDFPLWRTIVIEHDCGLLVDPASPSEVAAAVRRYADDPGLLRRHSLNARRLAVEKLNWSSEADVLLAAYGELWKR
jgi:glycosyltransferase involved in cell wall biosynthesis